MSKQSFFEADRQPYYIWSSDYDTKSAGIRALHRLCHALNELGEEAYLIGCTKESLHLRTPLLSESDVLRHQQLKLAPIVIYPEVISGNPLQIPNVVRWLLNRPGHLGGDMTFDNEELLFAYNAGFIPENMPTSMPILCIPIVDITVFNNLNNPDDEYRKGHCFYANKYLVSGSKLTEHVLDATSLGQDVELSQKEIAAILRRSEFLYCYEPSAIITEALLCGCPVVMIPTPYLAENFNDNIEGDGIAVGFAPDQLETAKNTVHKVTENYQTLINDCWTHVRCFRDIVDLKLAAQKPTGLNKDQDWVDATLELIAKTHGNTLIAPKLPRSINEKKWLKNNTLLEGQAVIMAERMLNNWQQHPTFHLIIVINQHELALLSDTLSSLQEQLYSAWGLTIISGMPQPEFFSDLPENIEWLELSGSLNSSINQAVSETGLDWIMQLLPGDQLRPHGLLSFAEAINQNTESRFIYSDEEVDEKSSRLLFKPDFNLTLLYSASYLGRSVIIRRDTFQVIGGYTGLAYVYVTDLALSVYETWGAEVIAHIPDVLYCATHVGMDEEVLSDSELSVRVGHFQRQNIAAKIALLDEKDTFHVNYLDTQAPLISIIIANKNNASAIWQCIDELSAHTDYANYELIIVDCQSDIEDMDFIYQDIKEEYGDRFNLLSYAEPNYSAMINFAVTQAKGDYIVILANSAMPVNNNWLSTMNSIAQRPETGVVGVRVIDANNNLVHGGGVLGATDDVKGLFLDTSFDDAGYMGRAKLRQEYTFVSSACFMVSVKDYLSVGGLDEGDLANSKYCVADLCLKLKRQGLKTIWEPQAVFRQNMDLAENLNGLGLEYKIDVESIVIDRWPESSQNDSSYNRNLSLRTYDFQVETDIKLAWDRQNNKQPRIMAFPFNETAIGRYRIIEPLRELTHAAMIESTLLPGHDGVENVFIPNRFEINKCRPEIMLMHLTLNDDFYEFLKWIKAETDIFVIFSIDDLVTTLPSKNDSKKKLHKDMRYRLRRTLALCDRVITSTQPLADALALLNDDIVVMPNCIELARWEMIESKPNLGEKLRVGWAGGQHHAGDLDIILDVVKATSTEVDWIFMGMYPKELKPYIHEYHEFTTLNEYPEKLASLSLDLALAPLEIHPFNEAKSNLKLLEYGMLACPVICTDIYPYQTNNPPVTRVNNTTEEWLDAIRTAIADPELLKDRGQALKTWVLRHYVLEQHRNQWFKALTTKEK